MTPRSLFNVILKILGIFFIRDFFSIIPQLISVGIYLSKSSSDTIAESIASVISTFVILLIYGFICYLLIFKTESVVKKLKLYNGFDQDVIPFNIHRSTVLSISIIVIGGLLVSEQIPNCINQIFSYYQEKKLFIEKKPNPVYIYLSLVRIIIGLFLMTGQRQIVNLIEKQRKK